MAYSLSVALFQIPFPEREEVRILHSRMHDRNMLLCIFVKSILQFTKGHLYHLLGESDHYVMYEQRAESVL